MNLHTLKNTPGARHRPKRVGCGESSGHGKTSGRGNKGQMARSGHKRKPAFEGGQMRLIRRLPKRGFIHADKIVFSTVNVSALARFDGTADVTPAVLHEAGLVRNLNQPVKILGDGNLEKKLNVKAQAFSASARTKIESVGGTCNIIP